MAHRAGRRVSSRSATSGLHARGHQVAGPSGVRPVLGPRPPRRGVVVAPHAGFEDGYVKVSRGARRGVGSFGQLRRRFHRPVLDRHLDAHEASPRPRLRRDPRRRQALRTSPACAWPTSRTAAPWVGDLLHGLQVLHGQNPGMFQSNPVDQFHEHCWVAPFVEDNVPELAKHLPIERILFGSDLASRRRHEPPARLLRERRVVLARRTAQDHGRQRGGAHARVKMASREGLEGTLGDLGSRTAGSDPEAALLRSRTSTPWRWNCSWPTGLADGLPARGDPRAGRLRRIRRSSTSRSSSCAPTTWKCTAFHNACRHRAVKGGRGRRDLCEWLHLPVPWLVLRSRRRQHLRAPARARSPTTTSSATTSRSSPCAVSCGAAAPGSTSTPTPPPLRESTRAVRHLPRRVEGRDATGGVVGVVPAARELEARDGRVHGGVACAADASPTPADDVDGPIVDTNLDFMRTLSIGMAGMIHEVDVRIAEGLRDVELPEDPALAAATWRRTLNDAVVRWWSANGVEIADLNELDRLGHTAPIEFCFPNTFILPMFSSASAYRFRPVGPEETLMEIWSLTRFPDGVEERARPIAPTPSASRRRELAAHPRPGLRQHPEATARSAQPQRRVHAARREDRGTHLELRARRRRVPRRSPRRAARPRDSADQRPDRRSHRRVRLLRRDYEAVPVRRSRSLVAYFRCATSSYTMTWSAAAVVY